MFPRTLVLALALGSFSCNAQTPASQPSSTIPTVEEAIHDLSVQRDTAELYVQLAREIKDQSVREQAWLLYGQARAQYNAFIDDIATGINIGGKREQQQAMKHAADAYQAGEAFQNYVKTQRAAQAQDHMGATPLASLMPVAETLIQTFLGITLKPPSADDKKLNLISRVEGYKWPEWHTVDTDLSPNPPEASPAPPTTQPTKPQTPKSDHQGL